MLDITLDNNHVVQADLLLSAIGIHPNLDLAQAAKLKTNRGIIVNEYLQTSNSDIYALGDCAEVCGHVLQFIAPISHSTTALAQTLTGAATKIHYPAMPVAVKTPVCPVVLCLPPRDLDGKWDLTQDEKQY